MLRLLMLTLFMTSFHITISFSSSLIDTKSSNNARQEEAIALLKWKDSLHDQSHSLLPSWSFHPPSNSSSSSPCNWFGISCNKDGRVVDLSLTNLGLAGTLDTFDFEFLPYLSGLNLSYNTLLGTIPVHIGNLSRLNQLDLSFNQFSGKIPSEIGGLANLSLLRLMQNRLNGSIPPEIGNLVNLNLLSLPQNKLTGFLPPSLGKLKGVIVESGSPEEVQFLPRLARSQPLVDTQKASECIIC